MVLSPVCLGTDTDDEDTLVNEEIYNNGEYTLVLNELIIILYIYFCL